jgi:peptide/nickel transport system substrate-binding protein
MNTQSQPLVVSRRRLLQLTGGAITLSLISACIPAAPVTQSSAAESTSADTQPQRGGLLRVALIDDVNTLDPGTSIGVADVQVGHLVYENLVRRAENEPGAPLYPALAETWEMNEDATVYTFTLRQGVTFQHGTAFTAKDVEYSINRLLDPALAAGVSGSLGAIDKMEVVDDFTIKFHLKAANVVLPYTLAGPGVQIVPHDRTTEQIIAEASGTGPFVLAERVPGERTVFKRNESYWDKALPYLDEVQLLVLPEPATQIAALTGGTIDLIHSIGLESVAMLEGSPDVSVLESSQGNYPVFVMRADQKPFDDLRVRQALKHAVDRAALLTALMDGRGNIGNDQPIGPGTPFWVDLQPLAYDVEKAKALLAEAGYADGVEVALSTSDIGGPRVNDAAIALQEMVKAAGFTITIDKVPVGDFWSQKYMQAPFFASWWPVFSDPNAVLPLAYSSDGFYNESGWSDPTVDELIAAGRAEQDAEQRKQIYAEAQQIISEQGGVLIPYFAPYLQAMRNRVQGHTPASRVVYQNVWLAQA